MTISYPLSIPTVLGAGDITLRAVNSQVVNRSPYTFKSQTLVYPGQVWSASVTLPPMNREQAEEWVSFLISLNGTVGTFYMGDPNAKNPRGLGGSGAEVDGANSAGNTLDITTTAISQTNYLKAGDYIQLGFTDRTLHKVLKDVDTDGSGNCTLDIWPSTRSTVADGTNVKTDDTTGIFSLTIPSTEWNINNASQYGLTFECMESIT